MYKICWKSKFTGKTGCGEPVFTTEKSAQDTADDFRWRLRMERMPAIEKLQGDLPTIQNL